MSREEIIGAIKAEVERIAGAQVVIHRVQKNNGVNLTGISILVEESSISPTIYIDSMVDCIISGSISVTDAAEKVIRIYEENKANMSVVDIVRLADKKYILDNVTLFLVNGEKNARMKEDAPHRDFLDLTVFYRVIVNKESPDGVASYILKNQNADLVGVTEQELFDAAMQNTDNDGYSTQTMAEITAEMMGVPVEEMPPMDVQMFVISTKNKMWGASVLMHTGYIKELADRLGSDLYILPSSIHEIIAIPTEQGEVDAFKSMVQEVNATQVSPEEVLGNEVYVYSRNDNLLTVA